MNRRRKINDRDRIDAFGPLIRHCTRESGFFYAYYDEKTGLYRIEDMRDYNPRPLLDRLIVRGKDEGWLGR